MTCASGPILSRMIWRQAPHGVSEVGFERSPLSQVTASRTGLAPAAMALKIPFRSAQIVRPYEADSTLQPRKSWPSAVSTAAPTGKWEYGASALSAAFLASASSSPDVLCAIVFPTYATC